MQFYCAETVMFITNGQLIFSYIGQMDCAAGHLANIVGVVSRAFDHFFQMLEACPGRGDAHGWN